MQKKAYPIGKPGFPKRKTKDVAMFFVSKRRLSYTEIFAWKSPWKSGKIKFHTKNRQSVPSSSTVFVGVKIVRQLYLLFFFFWLTLSGFFRCIESFPYCSISEYGCLIFHLLSFLCYLDSVCQLLGSYGGHVLVTDPVKWAKLCSRAESFEFETPGLLFPSSANLICGRQRCPTTWFTFFIFLTNFEEARNWRLSLLMLNDSNKKYIGEFLLR